MLNKPKVEANTDTEITSAYILDLSVITKEQQI